MRPLKIVMNKIVITKNIGFKAAPFSLEVFENAETDPVLADIGLFWWIPAYLARADPNDPLVSPLRGLERLTITAASSKHV